MFKKTSATAGFKVRSLVDADPNYAVAKELVDRLKTGLQKLDAEENELFEKLRTVPRGSEETARVAALLGDEVTDDDSAPDGISLRLRKIETERIDFRAALNEAQQRLVKARYAASLAICGEVAPTYARRVQALAAALIAANTAHVELLDLISDLNREDVAWTAEMQPMQADRIFGHQGDRLGMWLKDALTSGFIKSDDIPQELKI